MPRGRPKNEKERITATNAAYSLFIAEGYGATKYSDIAEELGWSKSLVQYYFPSKTALLTSLLERIIDLSEKAADHYGLLPRPMLMTNFVVAQILYSYLFSTDEMVALTTEALHNRDVTQGFIVANEDYIMNVMDKSVELPVDFNETLTIVVGGIYENIYRQLSHNKIPNSFVTASAPTTLLMMLIFKLEQEECHKILEENRLSDALIKDSICYINERILLPMPERQA